MGGGSKNLSNIKHFCLQPHFPEHSPTSYNIPHNGGGGEKAYHTCLNTVKILKYFVHFLGGIGQDRSALQLTKMFKFSTTSFQKRLCK
jgi:hypothetical protein